MLQNELVFDLDAIEDKNRMQANKLNKSKPIYDIQWLENTLKTYYQGNDLPLNGEMTVPEFAMMLTQLLASKRSSDDLQTELFDLVGFDRIELIESLLNHR